MTKFYSPDKARNRVATLIEPMGMIGNNTWIESIVLNALDYLPPHPCSLDTVPIEQRQLILPVNLGLIQTQKY